MRKDIVKYMQDATPLTVGEEWTGYEGVLPRNCPGTLRTLAV